MNTSSWFDAFALLVIVLMSVATGVAADAGDVHSARVLAVSQIR